MVLSSRINLLALPLRVRYLIMVLGVKKFTAILCSRLGFCFFLIILWWRTGDSNSADFCLQGRCPLPAGPSPTSLGEHAENRTRMTRATT